MLLQALTASAERDHQRMRELVLAAASKHAIVHWQISLANSTVNAQQKCCNYCQLWTLLLQQAAMAMLAFWKVCCIIAKRLAITDH